MKGKVVVVDDGSTDRTAKIARDYRATVYRIEQNSGKAFVFMSGLRFALKKFNPTILVSLDADLT